MEFRLLVVAAVLLAGCAGQQPLEPSDPKNKSDNNRFRDSYECEREAAFAEPAPRARSSTTA
jgi:outer membrane biogenesis lipoprotein LolB